MTLDKVIGCVSLGRGLLDKCVLAIFGLIAPERDLSRYKWWRLVASVIPRLWLKPEALNGLRVLINPTDWSQTVIFEEVFLRSGYDLTKVTFTPSLILDCGAHIGIFSLLARSTYPDARIAVYEPNPENVEMIRRQMAGNNVDIELVDSAVSTETRTLLFASHNSHSGTLLRNGPQPGAYTVRAINFPDAFKQMQANSLLLKMDIEGEETNILPILIPLLPRQSALFFETHGGEAGWEYIKELLVSHSFCVEQINDRGQFLDGFAIRE